MKGKEPDDEHHPRHSPQDDNDDAEGIRWYHLPGRANRALAASVAAGHVNWLRISGPVLALAEKRPLQLAWRIAPDGSQRLMPEVAGATRTGSDRCGNRRTDAGALDKRKQNSQSHPKCSDGTEISALF